MAEFDNFERSKHMFYYNVAPEQLEILRWRRMSNILNACIPDQKPVHDWEKRIVNIFLAKDRGDDLPEITDVYQVNLPVYNYYDEDYEDTYADDIENQRQLARQEKAASRHERTRGWWY
jgi:hypothetical protein